MTGSATDSPLPKVSYDPDKKVAEGESLSNHLFSSANSFFTNGHTGECNIRNYQEQCFSFELVFFYK